MNFLQPKIARTFYDDYGRRYDIYEKDPYLLSFKFRVIMKDENGKLHALYLDSGYYHYDNQIIKEFNIWVMKKSE